MAEASGEVAVTTVGKTTERTKPSLVQVGDRWVLSTGRWNDSVMADFLLKDENKIRWVKIGELAGTGCGANTIPNKKRVRGRLSTLFMELCERQVFLAIKYKGDNHAASEVKIANLSSEEDRQLVSDKLKRMKKRKEMSQEKYEKTVALLHTKVC